MDNQIAERIAKALERIAESLESDRPIEYAIADDMQKLLDRSVLDLGLSARIRNRLDWNGIVTLRQLVQMPRIKIKRMHNLGETSLNDLDRTLSKLGLSFGMNLTSSPKSPSESAGG